GTIVWDPADNGKFEFTAEPGFVGTVDIPYRTCDDGTPEACATATIHIVVRPIMIASLKLRKEGQYIDTNGDNVVSIGDHIQYTFSVVNIGDLDIENLVINDATIGVNGLVPVPSHLSPNHKVTATATYAITQADIDAGG